ncbi:MAG TPA: hypothetical protein VFN08_16625 [Gemmatimonadales bacterium]|nr:hypothetical protein [Gemmatimonadales bacterium]
MNPVRFVLLAMGSGMAVGVAAVSLIVLGVDYLRPMAPAANATSGPAFYLLMFGTMFGLVLAGVVAWWLLAPVLSVYRRGGLSLVTAMATVLPMLLCMAANQLGGRAGLVGLALAALLVAALLAARVRRGVVSP